MEGICFSLILFTCVHVHTLQTVIPNLTTHRFGPVLVKQLCDKSINCVHKINITGVLCPKYPSIEDKVKPFDGDSCTTASPTARINAESGMYGRRCKTRSACKFQGSICLRRFCHCKCGYYYSPLKNRCVPRCDMYDEDMAVYEWRRIKGYNKRTIHNVSLAECLQHCNGENRFVCVIADWNMGTRTCYLSDEGIPSREVGFYVVQRTRCK